MNQLELLTPGQPFPEYPTSYIPGFLTTEGADRLYLHSTHLIWHQNTISMFGKPIVVPRKESMYGDAGCSYKYRDVVLDPLPWTLPLLDLRSRIEQQSGYEFQVTIGNWYADGSHHIGWHSDDSPEMGDRPAIASISLGATRRFSLRSKATKETIDFDLAHGDLVIMHPGCQGEYVHCLRKSKRVEGDRINWTFRPHIGGRLF